MAELETSPADRLYSLVTELLEEGENRNVLRLALEEAIFDWEMHKLAKSDLQD